MIKELELVIFTWANSSTLYVAPMETDIAFYCTVNFGDSSLANWTLRVVIWCSWGDGPLTYWTLFCAVAIVGGTRIRINVATNGKPCQIKGTNWVRIKRNPGWEEPSTLAAMIRTTWRKCCQTQTKKIPSPIHGTFWSITTQFIGFTESFNIEKRAVKVK